MKVKKRPVKVKHTDGEEGFNILRKLFKDICDKRGINDIKLSKLAGSYALRVNKGVNNQITQTMKVNTINNISKPSITYKMFIVAMNVLEAVRIKINIEVEFKDGKKVEVERGMNLRSDKVLVVNEKENEDEST